MKSVPLYIPFCLALAAALFCSAGFPALHLSFFAPFLALAYYTAPFSKSLWISLGCGVILDLISSEFRFGLMTLTWALTTLLVYKQKKHFFEDKPLALSLFTAVIAAVSTTLELTTIYLFDRGLSISFASACIDTLLMSAVDGLYAFLWFTCPLKLYKYIKKVGWRGLFPKIKHEEEQG